jgi:hypothetical protein
MAEGFKETLTQISQSLKDTWSKLADAYYNRSDRERRTILLVTGGVVAGLVLIIVLKLILFAPDLAVRVAANTSGMLGDNFIAVENREQEPIIDLVVVLDERYVYNQQDTDDVLDVGEVLTLTMPSFSAIKGGTTAAADYVPKVAVFECDQGSIEIDFLED